MRRSLGSSIAVAAAILAVVALAVVRFGGGGGIASQAPEAMLPILLATAALCVIGLVHRRHPGIAWLAAIAALTIATVDVAAFARANRAMIDGQGWRWLSIAICAMAILTVTAAAGYASDRHRRLGSWVMVVAALGVGLISVACLIALGDPDGVLVDRVVDLDASPLGALGLVTRTFLVLVFVFVGLGLLGDARPAAIRARRRVAVTRPPPASPAEWVATASAWSRAFVDEASPGRSRARRAALDERARLARELHAEVVPAVRRALAEAERDGSPERLADALREVLHEVDDLVQAQHSIQLEIGGLVPALEWLAERVEDRSDIRVTIDVVDGDAPGPGEGGAPPAEVAAAAVRVARLALENVIRHAPGSDARLVVTARADHVTVSIADDGPGLPDGARGLAADGRRGLADMEAEAAACGANLVVGQPAGGTGTTVTFHWPADRA